jgi:hypothetical protein
MPNPHPTRSGAPGPCRPAAGPPALGARPSSRRNTWFITSAPGNPAAASICRAIRGLVVMAAWAAHMAAR